MKSKQNEAKPTEEKETFLRIFPNVKRCKALDWEERILLSNYISFQIQGQEFYQTDSYQGMELGLSPAQVSKYTGRLKERGIIDTKLEYEENPKGGRPIPVRYVRVIDMDKWTKGDTVPVVKKFLSKKEKKKKALEEATLKSKPATSPNKQAEVIPVSQSKLKRETTLEEDLAAAEAKENLSIQIPDASIENDVVTVDAFKGIEHSWDIGRDLRNKTNGEIEYVPVNVKFADNDIISEEGILLPNGKYFLKSTFDEMDKAERKRAKAA